MDSSKLLKNTVLKLNQLQIPIGVCCPKDAFIALSSGSHLALRVEYGLTDNGEPNFEDIQCFEWVPWQTWIEHQPRPFDVFISAGRSVSKDGTVITTQIRSPMVIMSTKYDGIPVRKPIFSRKAIYERDNGTCQYSGRKLSFEEGNIDHVLPRSKGGRTSFENCVLSDKRVNTKKGSKTLSESGLKLLAKPKVPRAKMANELIKNTENYPDWRWFVG